MYYFIFEQLIKKSISSANEIAAGMQNKDQVKQVHFVCEVEKAKKKLIIGDRKKDKQYWLEKLLYLYCKKFV